MSFTILIVDDDPGVVDLNRGRFEEFGEVRYAYNIPDAFEQMRRLPPPDLVLLDLIFPGPEHPSSAEETLRHIGLLKQVNPNAVVVVITGSSEERLQQLALEMGADSFLHKRDMASQKRLMEACMPAFQRSGGQSILDKLNELLTPQAKLA